MKVTPIRVALGLAACLSATTQAETVRQWGAHEHGTAQLNLVAEGQQLLLELVSPAFNLVGFEHQPNTEVQRQKLEQVLDSLHHPASWLVLPDAAGCQLASAEVSTPLTTATQEHDEAVHPHDDHEHEDDHHALEGEHGHEEGHHPHEGEHDHAAAHSEIRASYLWQCAAIAKLDGLAFTLFAQSPHLTTLQLQAITPSGNQAMALTADSNRLRF